MDRHVRATACGLAAVHRPWPVEVRCFDLAEEVGELARAVLVAGGHTGTAAPDEEVAEALCDVFALVDQYHVELDERFIFTGWGAWSQTTQGESAVPAMAQGPAGRKDRGDPPGQRAAPGVRLRELPPPQRRHGNHRERQPHLPCGCDGGGVG